MSEAHKAVFLSYASQDAEAAKRIANALRGAGVEVWFDAEGGLEHGDEWDAKIRRQIKECVLFIPVISANTEAREEGYFRLEWDMAAERARNIANGVAFILPVVIDGTKESAALVPDRFRTVQWTKLPGGVIPPDVLQRFLKLWSHRTGALKHRIGKEHLRPEASAMRPAGPHWLVYAGVALACITLAAGAAAWLSRKNGPATSPPPLAAAVAAPSAPLTEAGRLIDQAWAIFEKVDNASNDEWDLAEKLAEQATKLEPSNAEAWAVYANVTVMPYVMGLDPTPGRLARSTKAAQRAVTLDAQSINGRVAVANCYRFGDASMLGEAERIIRGLMTEQPRNQRVLRTGGNVLRYARKYDESITAYDRAMALPGGDPMSRFGKERTLRETGRFAEAEVLIDEAMAANPGSAARIRKVYHVAYVRDDLDLAARLLGKVPGEFMMREEFASVASSIWLWRRDADRCIEVLRRFPGDRIGSTWKGHVIGRAYQISGREEAARLEWQATLRLVDAHLASQPGDINALFFKVSLLATLGDKPGATTWLKTLQQVRAPTTGNQLFGQASLLVEIGQLDEAVAALEASFAQADSPRLIINRRAEVRHHPTFDPLRSLPRFQALRAKLEAMQIGTEPAPANREAAVASKGEDKSVAVLAFANLSDDKANEYFSDGISEELLNVLAKVPGLKVSARTSAFYFKGKEVPIPEIAKQLGVAYVVEGSVRKAGDKVRITAQLIKAADGFHVWSETFTRDLKDIFAVQDEIAGLIAKNLELKMGMVMPRPTIDIEAYQEYLAGRALFAKASNDDMRMAVGHFEKALAIEPKFTAAWVQLASAHTQLGRWGGAPTLQAWAAARTAVDRALALEPDSPDVLLALGWILRTGEWDWRGAERAYRRALELRPNHPDTLSAAAVLLFNLGRKEEALRLGRQAVQLDPLNPATQIDLSLVFYFSQEWAEQEKLARRAIQLAPAGVSYHGLMAYGLAGQRRFAEAEAEARLDTDDVGRFSTLGIIAALQGQEEAARGNRRQLEQLSRARGDTADLQLGIADISVLLGDKDQAFAALEKAVATRDPSVAWFRNDHYLQLLRADPRWDSLLRKVGLADEQLK